MKRSLKKVGVVSIAVLFIGTGINGLALAANGTPGKPAAMEHPLPPMMHKMIKDIDLTEAQKAQLTAVTEKQKALRDQFWAVFTEDQKTVMLEKMLTRHHKDTRNGHRREGRHDKGPRNKGEQMRWGDNNKRHGPREECFSERETKQEVSE